MHLRPRTYEFGIPSPELRPDRFRPLPEPAYGSQSLVSGGRPHVLVVDDENLIADSVAAILNRNGFDAVARYSGVAALASLEVRYPDIVVSDAMLPDLDGIQMALSLRLACPKLRVVLFSGNVATASLIELATGDGYSFELLTKPVHPADLLRTLRAA